VCESFHGAGRIAGWVTSGEVPLCAGGGCWARPDEARRVPTRDDRGPVPEQVAELYGDASDVCESKRECLVMAQLLFEYKDVFSCGEHDMGLTKAVCHEIPLAAGTVPIWQPTRQPTRRLGPEKERKMSRQVQDLLNRDLIEPGHGA